MDYGDAVQYLDRCLVFGIKPSLVRIKKLLQVMDSPQEGIDFIHIVGSNGKTSTTRMTAAILHGQGIDCGYHISPHIKDYTERFWYKGGNISREEFASLFEEIYPFVQQVNGLDLNGNMTQFEIIAGMGFLMAKNFGLQVMVLEAGMGGRWDATNAVFSRVVGLTGVSLEHTSILGNSVEEIAVEKVEVLKQGAVAATTSEDKQVVDILKNKALEAGGQVLAYRKDFDYNHFWDQDTDSWSVDMKGVKANYNRLKLPLKGRYQVKNMALAVVLSQLYLGQGKLDEERLKKSLSSLKVKGRFEIIRKDPEVIADASHNPEGIKWLCTNLREYFPRKKKVIIFAVLEDKDYREMVEEIIRVADILIITSSGSSRSLDIDLLEEAVISGLRKRGLDGLPVYKIDNIVNSLNFALKISDLGDIICITGSITNLEPIL